MSEIEKVRSQIDIIAEGLSTIVGRLTELEEVWASGGRIGAELVAVEKAIEALQWEQRTGNRGPYEWVTKRQTEDSDAFRVLLKHAQKRGHFSAGQFYYWPGSSGDVIFRRKKKRA